MMFIMGSIWSLATGACAFAGTFAHLFIARFFVGAGEAGYNPAAQALLAASFPRRRRTMAIGLAQFGMALGPAVGMMTGAFIATRWGWRHAFGLVAVPGLLLSIAALFLRDFQTPRAGSDQAGERTGGESYLRVVWNLLRTPTLFFLFLGQSLLLVQGGMLQSWMPTYYVRMGGLSITSASALFSAVSMMGCLGMVAIGVPMDAARRRWPNFGSVYITVIMACQVCAFLFVFLWLPVGGALQTGILASTMFLSVTTNCVVPTLIMDVAHPAHRGTAVSLLVTMQNLIGYTLGPVLAGFLSDRFSGDLAQALHGERLPWLWPPVVTW